MTGRESKSDKHRRVNTGEIETLKKLEVGEALGADSITVAMLKYGGGVVMEWILWICNLA